MDHLTEEQKRRIIEKHHIKAELDLERTILAKQRTLLAEINVFLAVVGLGLLLLKFFDYLLLKIKEITIFIKFKIFIHFKIGLKCAGRDSNFRTLSPCVSRTYGSLL